MKKHKLKYYRNIYNLKQKDLADLLCCTVQTYSKKENGIYNFADSEKIKIQEFFKSLGSNLSIDELFF